MHLICQKTYIIITDITLSRRPTKENWWRSLSTPTGMLLGNPFCAAHPNPMFTTFTKISSHEFFRLRNINIPVKRGKSGIRLVSVNATGYQMEKIILECECQIQATGANEEGICIDGKLVILSRGVGGDKSFFVYTLNSSTGFYNVRAHICFRRYA